MARLGVDGQFVHAAVAGQFEDEMAAVRDESKAGTVAGFDYSRAFKTAATWDWNEDLVAGWIGAPGLMVPGTAMGVFQGVAPGDRDDIVAYLATQQ